MTRSTRRRLRTAPAVICLLLAMGVRVPSAAAAPEFDLGSWVASLPEDRPAGGQSAVYEGGRPLAEEVRGVLAAGLHGGDPRAVGVVLDEAAAYGVPAGEALLLEFADSPAWAESSEVTRVGVLRALRRMRSGRALPLFARVAFQEEGRAVREAIRALCASGAPEALPPLRALAGGEDRRRRNLVVRYLRRSGEREAAGEARGLRRDAKKEAREDRRDERRERREERTPAE